MSDDQSVPTQPTQQWSPPQPSYIPPAQMAAAPPKSGSGFKKGFGAGFGGGLGLGAAFAIFGLIMGLISLAALAGIVASIGQAASPKSATERTRVIWGAAGADAANTIRAINISGAIQASGGDGLSLSSVTYGYEVASLIDSIKKEDAAGIVLLMNTPGGTINGSRAIADAVERYQERTGNKVIAYVQGMSASGGMYAMAGADEIIADHGSLVGSIGVIFGPFQRYKDVVATSGTLLSPGVSTRGGITQEYLTQGTGKDFGNPYRDMTAEERAKLTAALENEYNEFVNWVAKHRNLSAEVIKNDLGAFIYDGKQAKAKGLIDAQLGPDEAYRHIAQAMGLDPAKASIVVPKAPSFFDSLFGAEMRIFGQSAPLKAGETVTATSVLCSTTPGVLAVHGSLQQWCG